MSSRLPMIVSAGGLFALLGCHTSNDDIAAWQYVCGGERPLPTDEPAAGEERCGEAEFGVGRRRR